MTSPTYSPMSAPALKLRQANNPKPLASPQSLTSMPPPFHRWRRRLPHLAPSEHVLGVHSMNEALAGHVPVVKQPICFASSSDSLSSLSLVRWSLRLRWGGSRRRRRVDGVSALDGSTSAPRRRGAGVEVPSPRRRGGTRHRRVDSVVAEESPQMKDAASPPSLRGQRLDLLRTPARPELVPT